MAWQSDTINPASTSPAGDITKITNDLQQLRGVIGGTPDAAIPSSWPTLAQQQVQLATAFTSGGTAPAFTLTPSPAIASYAANQRFRVKAHAAGTTGSNTLNVSGLGVKNLKQYDSAGAKIPAVVVSGQLFDAEYDGTDFVILNPVTFPGELRALGASVASNALTVSIPACSIDFRSATLGSGAVNTRSVTSILTMTVSSGSTLGTVSGQASRIAVLAIDNAGTVELAVVNLAGGVNLDESALISTTAEGGAGAADSAGVIYSTTARTNVPFRVMGYVESTQTTAGTWAAAPSRIQGAGGNSMTALDSLGYGQTWQSVTRANGTTYYNTTGRPIVFSVTAVGVTAANNYPAITVGGVLAAQGSAVAATNNSSCSAIIPPGAAYSWTISGGSSSSTAVELR